MPASRNRRRSRSRSPHYKRHSRSISPRRRSRSRSRGRDLKSRGGGNKGGKYQSQSHDRPQRSRSRERRRYSKSRSSSRSRQGRRSMSRSKTPPRNKSPSGSSSTRHREDSRKGRGRDGGNSVGSRGTKDPKKRSSSSKRDRSRTPKAAPSPKTLDDLLLSSKPLLAGGKKGSSLFDRYEEQDINVISIHSKAKKLRSQSVIEDDGSRKDFYPTEVMDLFHELNSKTNALVKKPRPLFDREEIRKAREEEKNVKTQVIRLLPSEEDLKKFEGQFTRQKQSPSPPAKSSRRGRRRSRSKSGSRGREAKQSTNKLYGTLYRTSEKRRHTVTDLDLLDDAADNLSDLPSAGADRYESQSRKPIRDRLGAVDKPRRYEEADKSDKSDRHSSRKESRRQPGDLRHSLSSRSRDTVEMSEPVVTDYGHRSVREPREEIIEDFSKRPDKGKVDISEFDPTYVPKGGRYDEHDDRDLPQSDRRFGRRGGRGRGFGGSRGSWRRPGSSWKPRAYSPNRRRDKGSDDGTIVKDFRTRKSDDMQWKHDKFSELENELERKAEPSSTTN